ncbi:MAG: tetratricopeptide repeat protein [Gemmatimonas sp.]
MSNADRIEELRNKYEENPRRYFAPLANEYRKAGDLAQAISICREHLPKQPGHMSGYIVFGQTLFEANNLEEARSVFEQALTLDPENLIALKHLGDIARMNGENGVARRWYARVLDADPRNDDIASQLASLGAPTPAVPVAAVPAPPTYSEPLMDEAVGVFATFDPSSLLDVPDDVTGIAGGNQFWAPPEPPPRSRHEPLDLDFPESPEPLADDEPEGEFEEGILAPQWPDTTELVARLVTPLRSATPISVPATPDAVAAFGREASDELAFTTNDLTPHDELVEAFLPPEAITRSVAAPETVAFESAIESESVEFETAPVTIERELVEFAAGEFESPAFADVGFADEADDAADVEFDSEPSVVSAFSESVDDVEFGREPSVVSAFSGSVDDVEFEREPSVVSAFSESVDDAEIDSEPSVVSAFSEPISVATIEPVSETHSAVNEFDELPSAQNTVVTPDETPTADSSANTNTIAHEWAEPESVPASDIEDFAFAAELPWEPETATESAAADFADTAEFEIPDRSLSGAYQAVDAEPFPDSGSLDVAVNSMETSFAEISPEDSFSGGLAIEPFAPVINESSDEISFGDSFAEVSAEALSSVASSEESFAEISTELQSERDASDDDSSVLDAVAHEATAVQANAEVSALVEGAAVSNESEKAQPFVTETMAELLVSQGFNARAIEVYDELVRRRPHDPVLVSRLAELRELEEIDRARAERGPTPRFNTPVRNTPLGGTPQYGASVYNTPSHATPLHNTPLHNTPLYNTPMSGTPVLVPALGDTVSANLSERHAGERLQAFRTARERFAELSRRRVARRTPTHATAVAEDPSDGLSSLFGTSAPTTTDELAARALADAFGPVQDSGESLFDPAPTPTPVMPMRSLTPRANTIVVPHAAEPRSDRQPSADYSFDKFFPDPAMTEREAQSSPTTVAPTPSSAQPVNEDLAQFSAWLKGLNNA